MVRKLTKLEDGVEARLEGTVGARHGKHHRDEFHLRDAVFAAPAKEFHDGIIRIRDAQFLERVDNSLVREELGLRIAVHDDGRP